MLSTSHRIILLLLGLPGSKVQFADASSELFIRQFPELVHTNNIHFTTVSTKSLRRFPASNPIPRPLVDLAGNKLDDLIHDNVVLVAMSGLLRNTEKSVLKDSISRRATAVMEAKGLDSLSEAKSLIIRQYLGKRSPSQTPL